MSKHTPGPWRAIPKVGTRGREWHVVNDSGGLIAEVDGEDRARLIAAAPDLYEALEVAKAVLQYAMPTHASDLSGVLLRAIEKARAALAKVDA